MKKLIATLALTGVLATSLLAQAPPIAAMEPINGIAGGPTGPLELWFPNVFDPVHPKLLTFEGFAVALNTSGQALPLHLSFDYLDVTGQQVYIPVGTFPGVPGAQIPITASVLLPFCPERVSIHFSTEDFLGYQIVGSFTHECIPEPAQIGLLAGLGVLGFGVYRRLRQRSKAA
jgi:hypothetical protein